MVKYLIILLFLTASASACEKDSIDWEMMRRALNPPYLDSPIESSGHDTIVTAELIGVPTDWRGVIVASVGDTLLPARDTASVSAREKPEFARGVANCPCCSTQLDWPDWADSARYDTLTGEITFYNPNPAREYMTVDTVGLDTILTQIFNVGYSVSKDGIERVLVEHRCVSDGSSDWPNDCYWFDVWARIDTTWHPKVQVWLTPEELKTLMALLHPTPFGMNNLIGIAIPVADSLTMAISADDVRGFLLSDAAPGEWGVADSTWWEIMGSIK